MHAVSSLFPALCSNRPQGKDYWAAHPARIFFEHILDLVMHYCRRPFIFKQLGGNGEVLLSLASIRQGMQVLQRRKQQQQQQQQEAAAAASGATSPGQQGGSSTQAAPADPALAKKAEEVKELRNALTFAQGAIKSDASLIADATNRYEGAKVEVEIAAKSSEMTSAQIEARLEDQEKRAGTIEAGPAAVRSAAVAPRLSWRVSCLDGACVASFVPSRVPSTPPPRSPSRRASRRHASTRPA